MRQHTLSLRKKLALSALIAAAFALPRQTQAATVIWDPDNVTSGAQDGSGDWTVGGLTFWNGVGNVATTNNITTDIAQFGSGGAGGTVNVSTQSINGLIFDTVTTGYTLTASTAGQVLTIGNGGVVLNTGALATTLGSANLGLAVGAAQSWTNNSSALFTVGGAVSTGANLLTIGGSGNTTISGVITGTNGLAKTGAGVLTLSGANTALTGTLTLSAGRIVATNNTNALGAGTLQLNGGILDLSRTSASGWNRNTTVGGNVEIVSNTNAGLVGVTHTLGTLSIGANTLTVSGGTSATSGTQGLTFGATTLTGAATFTVNNAGSIPTLLTTGTINLGTFALTKNGTGSMTASGAISGGVAAGSTGLTVSNGVFTSSANGTFTGNIAVSGSGVFAMPGNTFTTAAPYGASGTAGVYKQLLLTNGGTFRLTGGTFNNNATTTNQAAGIIFNIGTGGGTLDVVSGTLTIDDGTGTGTASTASQLQGSGTLTKTGLGTLNQDDSTAFAGQIIIAAGTFTPASANAGGATSANTVIQSGAQYNVNGVTMTNAEPLVINGTGLASAPAGAITSSTGTGTYVGPITLGSSATIGGGAGALTLSAGATVNIGANVLTLNQGAGRTTTAGVISGTGSVQVTGTGLAGDWANSAAHTYAGGTTLNNGTQTAVGVSSVGVGGGVTSGPFGTGTLVLNGGNLRSGNGAPFTIGNTTTLQANTTFYTVASEKTLSFTGPVTITGGTRTLTSTVGTTVVGTTVDFQGAIGDGGNALGIIKAGAGNITLSGTNTYTGATTVNDGTLLITGSLANNTPLSVTPTTATGARLSFVSNAANSPVNFSSLALGSATGTTFLGLDLGTASDLIATTAAATASNNIGFNINAAAGFGAGTYSLISAGSGLTAGGATYSLVTAPGGYTYAFNNTDSLVQLTATAAAAGNRYWRGNINNSWAALSGLTTTNWATDAAGTVVSASTPGAGDTVYFSATSATGPAITTTVDNAFTINDLQILSAPTGVTSVAINPGINPGTLSAGTVTLAPALASTGLTVAQGAGAVTIAAPLSLGASQTWSVDSSTPGAGTASSLTVSGAISGGATNSVTFNTTAGTTPIILSGAGSTYSGASTINANTIVQGGATNALSPNTSWTINGTLNTGAFNQNTGSLINGTGIVQNGSATNGTLTIGSDNLASATFSGTIQNGSTGTLGITKAGTGLQILSGINTYTGTTTVTAGTLRLGSAVAAVPVAVSGGTLQVGGNLPATATVTLSGTGTLDLFGTSQTVATLASAATNTITNSSTSTSPSTATAIGTPSGTGVYVDALTITGAAPGLASIITDGPTRKTQIVTNNANSGTGFMGFTNGALSTFSGGLVLANNATGTRLTINAAITGTPFGTGPIIIGQSVTDRAGIFFSTAGNNVSLPIVVNTGLGNDRFGIRNDGQTITLSGLITANTDAVFSSNSATASNTSITNKITGAGGLAIDLSQTSTANTSHTVTLNTPENANDYAGDTIVGRTNAAPSQNYTAILALGAANQIPNGSSAGNVILNNNTGTRTGTLRLNGFSDTINGLSGNGTLDGFSGTPTLTLGDNNATAAFGGNIINTAGTLTLTKVGSGTQTLSGTSTFGGPINVNGGFIAFASSPATSGPLGNSTTVNLDGGGLSYTPSGSSVLNRSVAIGAGNGTLDVANVGGTLSVGSITSTGGNLIKTGPGTVQITSTTTLNGGSGGVVVNGGTLQGGFGTGGIGSINVASGSTLSMVNAAADVLTLGGTGSLTLNSGAALTFELGASGINDAILYNTAATSGTISLNFVNLGGLSAGTYNLLNINTGANNQLLGTNFVLGSAPLGFNYTINNNGTLVSLTTTASSLIYWNNTQTDGSWANVTGNLGSIGAGAGTNFTLDSAGATDAGHAPLATETVVFSTSTVVGPSITTTLDGNRTIDSLQFNGAGTPAVTSTTIAQGSAGTLTLKPASASGGIAITAAGASATISAPIALDNTLATAQTWSVADATSTLTISGNVAFGADVNKTGAGVLTLSGANSGSGNLNLNSGTLNLDSSGALGTGTLSIANGTTLNNTSGGAVVLSGNGPININGSFTFTGANSLNLGTGGVTIVNNPIITTSANSLTLGGNVSGTANFTKAGAGTLVLTGTSSYTGITSLNAGTLSVSNIQNGGVNSNLGASSNAPTNLVFNGGTLLYTGTTQASDRGFTINTGVTATIDVATGGNLSLAGTTGAPTNGNLTKTGPGTLTLSGASTHTGVTDVLSGTLNITGSITGNTTSSRLDYGNAAGNIIVNHSGNLTAWVTRGANVAGAVSVFNQTAGTVTIIPTNGQDQQYLANNGGYGMLNITGGTFNTGRFDGGGIAGNNSTTAIIYVGGTGALTQNVGDWFLPIRNSGMMSMTIAPGGSFTRAAAVTSPFSITGLSMSATNNMSYGVFNVAGGNADTGTRGIHFSNGTFASGAFTSTGFVNVAGGTLSLGLNTGVGAAAGTTNGYFNYAGGTLRATAAMTAVIPANSANYTFTSTIFGPITNNNNANTAFNTQIGTSSNFTGGMILDTQTFAVTYPNVIRDGTGTFGVTQADIGDVTLKAGNSGYVGAPMVQFSAPTGGGSPASGYALLNSGQVTGIVITSPGTYASGETPTITLTGGGGSIAPFMVGALATSNVSSGLTKLGSGTLTLPSANTFSGPVDIQGGVLSVTTLANGGVASGLGASSNAATNVLLNGGLLGYNGTVAGVTDRNFTLTTNGGGFDASGTTAGTLTINTNIIVTGTSGAQTLTLQGTGTGATGGGTLTSVIADGTGTNVTSLAKLGTGSWTLGGSVANTYTGTTTVTGSGGTAGALILAKTGGALAIPGNITIGSGTNTQAHVLLAENEQISPTATVTLNGVNAGWAYIQLQGKTQTIGNIVETTPGYGVIETREAAGTFGLSNAIFNVTSGTQTYQGYFRDINTGLDATNSLKLTKTGAGILQWGAATGAGAAGTSASARNYSGGTDIQNGTLQLLPANTAGNPISIVGVGNVSLNGGATFAGTLDLNGLNSGITGLDGTVGTVLGQVVNNATGTTAVLSIGNNGNAGNFAGLIRDNTSGTGTVGITKVGAGIQVLSGANTYTGVTTISAGTLSIGTVANGGSNSNIGAATTAASNLVLNGGTLLYTGAAGSTDRLFSLQVSSTIDSSGTGPVNFTNTGAMGFNGGVAAKNLTLTGTNTGNNTIAAAIGNNTGATSINKTGVGTWVLAGANNYTGTTTVTAGALNISGTTNTGAGNITVGSVTTGTLNVLTGGNLTTTGTLGLGSGIVGNTFTVQTGATVSVGVINNPWATDYTIDGTLTSTGVWNVTTNFTTSTFNGTGTISASALTLGNAGTGVNYTGTGTINLTGALTVASNAGVGTPFYTQTSGTLNTASILLGDNVTNTTGSRTFNLNGGRVNIGSGGIASTGTTTAPRNVNLGTGTLGASANWSSSQPMTLTTGNTTTFNTLDSVDNTTGRTITLTGILSGSGNLTKSGAGTLSLGAANIYTGATSVSGGTLNVASTGTINTSSGITITGGGNLNYNSATPLTSPVTLTAGTISGSGAINTPITIGAGAIQSPGNSPGIQPYGAGLTWNNGGTYVWEINNWTATPVAGTDFDQIQVAGGNLNISGLTSGTWPAGTFKIDITGLTAGNAVGAVPGFTNSASRSWTILTSPGLTGAFNANLFSLDTTNFAGANALGGGSFSLANVGNDLVLNFNAAVTTTGTTYMLAAAPTTLNILTGGSLPGSVTIQNTGTGTADTLSFTTLTGTTGNASVATATGTTPSGGPLAQGASTVQPLTVSGIANGSTTITSSVATATNTTLATPATLSGTAGTINVVVGNASFSTGGNSTSYGDARILSTAASNINYPAPNWSSNTTGLTESGGGPAAVATTATILMYNNAVTGGGAETVSMQWRTRTTAEANPANPNAVLSDIVNLTGMYSGAENAASGTGAFVLQMNYLQSTLDGLGLNENAIATSGELRLGWNNGGNWQTAVLGNSTGSPAPQFVGVTDWNSYYLANSAVDDGTDLALFLGRYGVDPTGAAGGVTWAVVNHNSEFAVIPEPSTLVLGGLALLGLAGVGLRRRRMAQQEV